MKTGDKARGRAAAVVLFVSLAFCARAQTGENIIAGAKLDKIEAYIQKQMKTGKIPGMSVTIVQGDTTVFSRGFGFADTGQKKPMTTAAPVELGSNSKAFTALGILLLRDQGLLDLQDKVSRYIPWLKLNFRGKAVDITLGEFLYQTSGIPFKTIGKIPASSKDTALEDTVRTLVGVELDHYPGSRFSYATINYDVLGLVIQIVSGQPFEEYIKENILDALDLKNTYTAFTAGATPQTAAGYKIGFLKQNAYTAPVYRGNIPAGYFITNADDAARWLKIQMGAVGIPPALQKVIEDSHTADRTVKPGPDGASYACGWYVFQDGTGEYAHGGNNPNYASYMAFRPGDRLGIALLANTNSSSILQTGQGIMALLKDREVNKTTPDLYMDIDKAAFAVMLVVIPVILATLWSLGLFFVQLAGKKRRFGGNWLKVPAGVLALVVFVAALAYCFYQIPDVLYGGLPWDFVQVWAPASLIVAVLLLLAAVVLFAFYYLFTQLFPKKDDKSFFSIIFLSLASGFGNALIIFIINEVLNRGDVFEKGLFVFFVMSIAIYVYAQRLVRTRLVKITNDMVYDKRVGIIERILKTFYSKIEQVENEKIYVALNNDTETISNFANNIITGITSLITMVCCFIYLGIINFYGLLISALVIIAAAAIYFFAGRSVNAIWEQTRDIQNTFFKYINDLVRGFKELNISARKRGEFRNDIVKSCHVYREKRIQGDLKFANAFIIGELLFTFVIGAVAFLFPIVFENIQNSALRNYIFVFLYMVGPLHGILNAIPNFIQINISWNRINDLIGKIELLESDREAGKAPVVAGSYHLRLENVEYRYTGNNNESFAVGPLNMEFKSGEIIFITGGNGSGKSTLAHLITGLYNPHNGQILVNGVSEDGRNLGEKYAAVFSDFHLFDKLYGIDHNTKQDEIREYKKVLRIEDKLDINDGIFSTIKLSTGQRKRIALMLSFLEDRPVYLFDEWAADQDPEFRKFFYYTLLPGLKAKGKCVIAITHDDRYFNVADRVVKMELGKIVEEYANAAY